MRSLVIDTYRGMPYSEIINRRMPSRIRDYNVPISVKNIYESKSDGLYTETIEPKSISFKLTESGETRILPALLHESIFHFYKAFYNYLAVLKLYEGELSHWAKITNYYAQFYLAKSVTTLIGQQKYQISQHGHFYIKSINDQLGSKVRPYRLVIENHLHESEVTIGFDRNGVNSHRDVWNDYCKIDHKTLQLYDLTFVPRAVDRDNPIGFIINGRNSENYSLDGYAQLDFNLNVERFDQYYERTYLKSYSHYLCDEDLYPTLNLISDLYHLFLELEVPDIPIDSEKLLVMARRALNSMPVLDKMIQWISEGLNMDSSIIEEYYEQFCY